MEPSARRNGASTRVVSLPDSGLSPVMSNPRMGNTGLPGALMAGNGAAAPGALGAPCAAAGPCTHASTTASSAVGPTKDLNCVGRIVGACGFIAMGFIGTGWPAG